tara:strand:- start:627 stop:938 length:312 start_codon:yes stop_codon:yes gene_type:complete
MERFIVVSERNKNRTMRINTSSIMCYYPSYDEKGFETIEYTTLQLTGNERMCKLDITGLCSELDQYFILLKNNIKEEVNYNTILTANQGMVTNKLVPEDYKMD